MCWEVRRLKQIELDVSTKRSLIHLGSLDSFDITEEGKRPADVFWNIWRKEIRSG